MWLVFPSCYWHQNPERLLIYHNKSLTNIVFLAMSIVISVIYLCPYCSYSALQSCVLLVRQLALASQITPHCSPPPESSQLYLSDYTECRPTNLDCTTNLLASHSGRMFALLTDPVWALCTEARIVSLLLLLMHAIFPWDWYPAMEEQMASQPHFFCVKEISAKMSLRAGTGLIKLT